MKALQSGKSSGLVAACILALCVILALVWVFLGKGCRETVEAPPSLEESVEEVHEEIPSIEEPVLPEVDLEIPEVSPIVHKDPAALLATIKSSLNTSSLESLFQVIGEDTLNEEQIKQIKEFVEKFPEAQLSVREVGEVEINKHSRWAISVEGSDEEIMVDVVKLADGQWIVKSLDLVNDSVPSLSRSPENKPIDSLTVADSFLRALLNKDFDKALNYSDVDSISDARIASLCIMFEEGDYELRARKPLRSLFQRPGVSAYMANVQTKDGEQKGQFGLTLERDSEASQWLVSEINLDSLLADYIDRIAGGDAYYTPLVKNPEGGDTLALYFEFNEEGLTPRAQSQLGIIASILKADSTKKLTLSGHADAIGSDSYNESLSRERANNVRQFLVSQGINDSQIRILAYGESKPRRENNTDLGRRANRRTEIYLDF